MVTITLSIILFWSFLFYANHKGGTPYCLSETYYTLGNKGWMFQAFMIAMCSLLAYPILSCTPEHCRWVVIVLLVSSASIIFVPDFKRESQHDIHCALSVISMIAICALWFLKGQWYMPIIISLCALRKNWLLGVEVSFFTLVWLYCLI